MKYIALAKCARIVVEKLVSVKEGELVTVFTDVEANRNIAEAMFTAAYAAGAEAILATMTPREHVGLAMTGKIPPTLVSSLRSSDAAIACTSRSVLGILTELRKEMLQVGSRMMHMYLLTEDIALRTIPIDYERLSDRVNKACLLFPKTQKAHLISPGGTDITFSLKDRTISMSSDGFCRPGEFDMIPSGYVGISPLEGTANGVVVLDGTEAGLGIDLIKEPIICEVKSGHITEVRGGFEAGLLRKRIEVSDENATNYAELGLGFNSGALPNTGLMLEDERSSGNVLVGLGRSTHLGGKVESNFHFDALIRNATITLDGKAFLKDGIFQI